MDRLITHIEKRIERLRVVELLERIPLFVAILGILLLNFASFHLNGNEEQYMLYAKQYMDPTWIDSEFLNEFAGTRVFYQFLVGSVLKILNFEQTLLLFRVLLCVLVTIPLTKLYKFLDFKLYEVLVHLVVLFLPMQSLLGGSWMLISVEPKGFSYSFVLFALFYFLANKWRLMLLFLVVATYFHVLVGVYATGFFVLTLFFQATKEQKKEVLKGAVVYALLILPFVWYLLPAVNTSQDYIPSTSWIYTYFRSPHHTAIFKDFSYFYHKHALGMFYCMAALLLGLLIHSKLSVKGMKRINLLMILTLLWVLLAALIAVIDREGVFLKYYPFRINTLSTFLMGLILVWFVFRSVKGQFKYHWALMALVLIFLFSIQPIVSNINRISVYINGSEDQALLEMGSYIKEETPKDAVVLSFLGDLSLTRTMERDRFVVYKFIPAVMEDIPKWYERELFKRQLVNNIDLLRSNKSYKIDYLLTKVPIEKDFLKLIKQNKSFFLYQVTESK